MKATSWIFNIKTLGFPEEPVCQNMWIFVCLIVHLFCLLFLFSVLFWFGLFVFAFFLYLKIYSLNKLTDCLSHVFFFFFFVLFCFLFFSDINECMIGTHTCDAMSSCTNSDGSFECSCNVGFEGDGITCTGTVLSCYFLYMISNNYYS